MSDSNLTSVNIPETLRQRLRAGKVIPFVGAGVSMAVRDRHEGKPLLPSWREMLEGAARRLEAEKNDEYATLVRGFLAPKTLNYLEAARYAREGLGEAIWFNFLRGQLDKTPERADPASLALPTAVWSLGSQFIITTNFDRVLHWVSPQQGGPISWDIEAPAELAALLRDGALKPTVWHLHGQINNASKLILTPERYSLLYPSAAEGAYPAALQTLRSLLASHTFLFIGFSLDDIFFRRQLDEINQIYEGGAGPHYVLMREADIALGLRDEKAVKVIPFSDFGEPLRATLQGLASVAAERETAPAGRPAADAEEGRAPRVADYDTRHTVFFVPFRQKGAQVIGREEALQAVRVQLTSGRRTAIGQTASFQGLGGLGKTQLAVEYAFRFRDSYPNGVIWLNADQDIDAQLTDLAEKARWASPHSDHKYKLETASQRLRTYPGCLIIFDNLEEVEAIRDYLPQEENNSHILVTSRTPQPGFTPVPINTLSEALSIDLLYQEAGRSPGGEAEEEAAREVARSLGGLPLALELAGAYLQYRPISFQQYRDLLRQNLKAATAVKSFGLSFTRHETDLYSTLKINEEVFEEEPRLRDILDLLTWSGSAPMGLSLMCQLLGVENPVELTGALGLGTLLRLLQKAPDAESYSIHRLVSEVRREEIPLDARQLWVGDVCQRMGTWFEARRREFAHLPHFEAEIDHLKAWQEHAQAYSPRRATRLIWLQSYPPHHRGRYREAKALIERALKWFDQNQVDDKELEASLLNDLGFCHYNLMEYKDALRYCEKALTIRLNIFGEQHADVADSLNDIGVSYGELDEFEQGLGYTEKALAIRLRLFGDRHPDTARSYDNTGSFYGDLNKPAQALEYSERALSIRLQLYGEQHPETVFNFGSIGAIYHSMCNFRRAYEYKSKALRIYREILGDQHPEVIKCVVSTSKTLRNLGRARQSYQLLDELIRKLPEDNPRYDQLREEYLRVRNLIPGLRRTATRGQGRKKRKKKS